MFAAEALSLEGKLLGCVVVLLPFLSLSFLLSQLRSLFLQGISFPFIGGDQSIPFDPAPRILNKA